MGKSIGIDLGRDNVVAAFSPDGNWARVLETSEKEMEMPSVVGLLRASVLVGGSALRLARRNPQSVVSSVLEILGRRYDDYEVGRFSEMASCRIVAAGRTGMAHVILDGHEYAPIEIVALILGRVKINAEIALNEKVTDAVVAVPVYFNEIQRELVRQAGAMAGLTVKRIVDAPAAALLAAIPANSNTERKTVLVYKLGSTALEISTAIVAQEVPALVTTVANRAVAGDHFDAAIMRYVISELQKVYPESEKALRANAEFTRDLKKQAECAKRSLTELPASDIFIFGALDGTVDVEVTVQRDWFEKEIRPDVEFSMSLIDQMIARAGLHIEDVDDFVLVGGCTQIPLVRRLISAKVGQNKINVKINPMHCVAVGAAMLAYRTNKKFCIRGHENKVNAMECAAGGCGLRFDYIQPWVKCRHCNGLHEAAASGCKLRLNQAVSTRATPSSLGASIGIDFGLDNVVAAFTPDGTNPHVLPTSSRELLTPSAVALHRDGSMLVGHAAVRAARGNPQNFIHSIRDLLGRSYLDAEVEKIRRRVAYRIVADNESGLAQVILGERKYSAIEISAMILERIKADAEISLGTKVTHAVITVPAYFNEQQREATRQAAAMAGLKVKRIVDEPTAAVVAFGWQLPELLDAGTGRTILVYDFGGRTFDVSVVFVCGGFPTVESISGDLWLGGNNFDRVIMDYVIAIAQQRHPGTEAELRASPDFMWQLKEAAGEAKRELCEASFADIDIFGALGGKVDVEVTINRNWFEVQIRGDIDHSLKIVESTVAKLGFNAEDIDSVLLLGGSTRIPLIRTLLMDKFGTIKTRTEVDPAQAVALGAAILASRTEKKFCVRNHENELDAEKCVVEGCALDIGDVEPRVRCPDCNGLHDKNDVSCNVTGRNLVAFASGGVTIRPFGVEMEGGWFQIVLPKGTRYPTREPVFVEMETAIDYQEWIIIPVYQGFEEIATNNETQGKIMIGPIPERMRVPKNTPLDVGFELSENGILLFKVKGRGALSWLDESKVLTRAWEQTRDLEDKTTSTSIRCPKCNALNPGGKRTCTECGEPLDKCNYVQMVTDRFL